jgi:tetratricopeptide (TPR) repeat protein
MTRTRASWRAPAIVLLVTVVAFLPTLRNGWVSWDDDKNFLDNPFFRGLGVDQLRWMWTTVHLGHYVPLSWMSLGLDFDLWGMTAAGYHATSLVLHAVSALLLYFIARRLIDAARPAEGDAAWAAAIGALLWAVHPLRVESVAWITERRDVLSGVFYFAALLAYLRSVGGARRWYAASLVAFVAALLSKGTAVTLPAALFIVNVFPLRRIGGVTGWRTDSAWRVYRDVAPFAVLSVAFTAVAFVALRPVDQLSLSGKAAVSAYSLCFYLIKTVVPAGLSPLYEMPLRVSIAEPRYVVSILVCMAGGIAIWRAAPRWPALAAAVCAFGALIFPLLGVHQNGPQIAADRYTYQASAALALLAGAALLAVPRQRRDGARRTAALIVLALATLTWRQLAVWQDGETLWAHVLRVEPRSALANNNYGNLLLQKGALDSAFVHYSAAVASNPQYAEAHDNLGVAYAKMDSAAAALTHYRLALESNPQLASAHVNWGVVLARQGDVDGAVSHYRTALAIDSAREDAHVNWGNALLRAGRAAEAIEHYRRALAIQPDDIAAHLNWGIALAQQGQLPAAIEQWQAVLAVDASQPDARAYLAQAMRDLETRAPKR